MSYQGWANKETWELVLNQDNTYGLVETMIDIINPKAIQTITELKSQLRGFWRDYYEGEGLSNINWNQATWAFLEIVKSYGIPLSRNLRRYVG